MSKLPIGELKALQRRLNLGSVHVCSLGVEGFSLAHTDDERALGESLSRCSLHDWLCHQDGPPAKPGLYVVTPHEVDAYSEPYPVTRYDFTPLRKARP